jgi:thioredoxin 1
MERKLVLAGIAVAAVVAVQGLGRAASPDKAEVAPGAGRRVPRLVDLGSGKCVPCKAMAPILDELRAEYAGRMEVVFIDVWKDRDAADAYGIHTIPTQVFFGADGRELGRHEGFMAKADILARWASLGVTF